ncbi:MAG TPA: hypothetical protein VJ835_11850 [Fimbriimonadaceae bacterium]|nr:hypothetical protein [Fimbriimonadaceae bacterium]
MKKDQPDSDKSPEKVPGSGRMGSNDTSRVSTQGEGGMSVPSNQRSGSHKFGSNDKGMGESRKGKNSSDGSSTRTPQR